MRNVKRAVTVGVAALGIAAATAVPAQAATTTGDIKQFRVTLKNSSGATLGGLNIVNPWTSTVVNPANVQRIDVGWRYLLINVRFEVWGGSGACHTTVTI